MQDGWRNMQYARLRPRAAAKPLARLVAAATTHPVISRVVSPVVWLLSFVVSILLRTAFLTLPTVPLWYIYNYFNDYWLFYFPPDSGMFVPAWPEPRTQLVVLMATIPSWGLCMAVAVLLWSLVKYLFPWVMRRRRGGDYEMAIPMEDVHPNGRTPKAPRSRPAYCSLSFACFVVFLSMALSGVYMFETYENPLDYRYRPAVAAALKNPTRSGHHDGTKVFIGAMFTNNIDILPHWIKEFNKVIYYLGTDNVFVSIVESNSWDGTAEALDEWKGTLDAMGVAHLIRTRDQTVKRPGDMGGNNRIDFLAAERNLVLAPLVEKGGYDVVVFSNDVLIAAESVIELLQTKNGEWDMVCGLDLARWGMYDAWVLRDRLGNLVSSLWPYFMDDVGMQAAMDDEPVPVFACWNGIVAFRAEPLLPLALRTPGRLSTAPLASPLPDTHPAFPQPAALTPAQTPPLAFRSSAPRECFSSESFLLPYDLRRQFGLQRMYLNPRVINSYEWKYYVWYRYVTRHWLVAWWMRHFEKREWMMEARMVVGDPKRVWKWDGGECHPWF
ncbi:cryptococcal mannosyltransferase 1-domain-containing protein [Mycena belliarum]|uniref:Cryptococcal mannosyltransferase 1-domain-containing protein n=1 Tax=Mycena belliarum TaxID=1033014 RepID=A0AAD6XJE6_9AGAR|nr:cryptococcal mannosyltransferase 1-domain-containing protein [Mycena belliae]